MNAMLISAAGVSLLLGTAVCDYADLLQRRTHYRLLTIALGLLAVGALLQFRVGQCLVATALAAYFYTQYRRHKDDDDDDTRGRRLRAWGKTKLRTFAPVRLRPIERSAA